MKLKRKHARIVWALVAVTILSLWGAILFAKSAFLVGIQVFAILAVVSCVLAFYLRLRWFICPHCEEGIAPPQLRAGKRHYCVRCGKPFIYDDEPDEQVE